jgi:hypothetical protein
MLYSCESQHTMLHDGPAVCNSCRFAKRDNIHICVGGSHSVMQQPGPEPVWLSQMHKPPKHCFRQPQVHWRMTASCRRATAAAHLCIFVHCAVHALLYEVKVTPSTECTLTNTCTGKGWGGGGGGGTQAQVWSERCPQRRQGRHNITLARTA